MRILLVDDDDAIREVLIVILENMLGECDILECVSANQAKKLLSSDPYFQLIISDYEMPGGNGDELYKYVQEESLETPFLLHTSRDLNETKFTSFPNKEKNEFYIQKGKRIEEFRADLMDVEVIATHISKQALEEEYKKVRIFYFYRYSKTLANIYLKLSDRKFVKIINKGDKFDSTIVDKYAQKRQEYLYVKEDEYDHFAGSMAELPFLVFDEDIAPEEKITRTTAIIQNMVTSTGLSKSIVRLAERNIDEVISEAQSTKKFADLLASMRNKMDYSYDHSYLLSYFCCIICDKLGWSTRRSREKLCFAALFHDVYLKDPVTAMVQEVDSPEYNALSDEQKQLFLEHPERAAEIVEDLAKEYPNIDDIILQHHEKMDRKGFPKAIGFSQIQPLGCLFILAHNFVSEMYRVNFEIEKYPAILDDMRSKYNKGHFLKIMEGFDQIFDKLHLEDL